MPMYEFECPTHGIWEEYFTKADPPEFLVCQHEDGDGVVCCTMSKLTLSIPSMHPDKHWAGTIVGDTMVHSTREFAALTANYEPATRANQEYALRRRREIEAEAAVKREKRASKIVEESLRGMFFSPDGNTVKEQRHFERQRESVS